MPWCKTKKHFWSDNADAMKCCNGWVRRIVVPRDPYDLVDCDTVIVNDVHPYGYKWVKERKTRINAKKKSK